MATKGYKRRKKGMEDKKLVWYPKDLIEIIEYPNETIQSFK